MKITAFKNRWAWLVEKLWEYLTRMGRLISRPFQRFWSFRNFSGQYLLHGKVILQKKVVGFPWLILNLSLAIHFICERRT